MTVYVVINAKGIVEIYEWEGDAIKRARVDKETTYQTWEVQP